MTEKDEEISKDVKELVIARLGIMPSNYKLSIGSEGAFTKDELIEHVMADDKIGYQITRMQLSFIKALTTGKFIDTLNKK